MNINEERNFIFTALVIVSIILILLFVSLTSLVTYTVTNDGNMKNTETTATETEGERIVEISEPAAEIVKAIENAAQKRGLTLAAPPVGFDIRSASENKTGEISRYDGYVEGTVALPDSIEPGRISTGVYVKADGSFQHVPTAIINLNGKYFAKIKCLTSGIYAFIWHSVQFKDMTNHWAKDAINDMGSRIVTGGVGNGMFEPEREITRAEFAAIIVKALGLEQETGETPFSDINESDWFSAAIKTALEYKIVSGYENGKFGPMDKITREQAMVMIANAMKVTGLDADLSDGDADELLAVYADGNKISDNTKESIAACIKAKIVSGRDSDMLAPQENITRAEVVVIIQRLLKESNLI